MSERTSKGCVLDARGCIDLESILTGFGAPISEEQAWALCYTTVQCFFDIKDGDKPKVSLSPSLSHVILHKDGYVHQETLLPTGTQGKATPAPLLLIQGAPAPGSAGCCLAHPACAGVLHQSIVCRLPAQCHGAAPPPGAAFRAGLRAGRLWHCFTGGVMFRQCRVTAPPSAAVSAWLFWHQGGPRKLY
uniref:KIND domain-containing protein n=1 Tax=Scylla olivacea TaxID=85551 RepID=A0A0P4WU08_SCYOL